MEIKISPKKINLEVSNKLKDKRHIDIFKKLAKEDLVDALNYAKSFEGKLQMGLNISDKRRKLRKINIDFLSNKKRDEVLKEFNNSTDTLADHKPTSNRLGEWLGVEIECFIPKDVAKRVFKTKGINIRDETFFCEPGEGCHENDCSDPDCGCGNETSCEGHSNDDEEQSSKVYQNCLANYLKIMGVRRVTVKDDGSIVTEDDDLYFPVEIAILFTEKNRESLKYLCDILSELKTEVNSSCGMHVHLDSRDLIDKEGKVMSKELTKRAKRLGESLPLLAKMVPKSRRRNSYCQLKVSTLNGSDRYTAVNLTAFKKYKTIEVRLHSATRDYEKISNWIDLLLLISKSTENLSDIESLDELCQALNVPEKLIQYIETRVKKFSGENEESAGSDSEAA